MILNRVERDSCGLHSHVTWVLSFQMFLCKHLVLDCVGSEKAWHRPQNDSVWRGGSGLALCLFLEQPWQIRVISTAFRRVFTPKFNFIPFIVHYLPVINV